MKVRVVQLLKPLQSSDSPYITLTASKRRRTALNQMEHLHLKWRVPLVLKKQNPALLLYSPPPVRPAPSKFIHWRGSSFCRLCSGFTVSPTFRPPLWTHRSPLSWERSVDCCLCGGCQNCILREFSPKADRKKRNILCVLYIWKLTIGGGGACTLIYDKIFYRRHNTWSCSTLGFEINKKKQKQTYQLDFKMLALHCISMATRCLLPPADVDWAAGMPGRVLLNTRGTLRISEVGQREACGGVLRSPCSLYSIHDSSSLILNLCRTESCSLQWFSTVPCSFVFISLPLTCPVFLSL